MNDVLMVIPHHNDSNELYMSLNSIESTEFLDVVIIDDGSTEKFKEQEVLDNFKASGKVYFIYLDVNSGIEIALNKGLELAREQGYPYIARLDCGDLNIGSRIKKQRAFLEQNKEIFLVGTWVNVVDMKKNHLYTIEPPVEHEIIQKKLFYNTMFVHPSVMMRTDVIDKVGLYPIDYPAAEDYAYFFSIAKTCKTANIPEVLLEYASDPRSISSTKRLRQVSSRIKVIWKNFYFGYHPVWGLIRNILLLFFSRNMTDALKRLFKYGSR